MPSLLLGLKTCKISLNPIDFSWRLLTKIGGVYSDTDVIQTGREMIERRKYRRNELMTSVQYTYPSEFSETILKGTITNYSNAGICLIVSQPLAKGQEIIVRSAGLPSSKRAIVRWQENISRYTYRVGLEFIRYLVEPGLHAQGNSLDNSGILAGFIRFMFGIAIGGLLVTVLVWISAQLGYSIPLVIVGFFLLFAGISFAVWGDKFFRVLRHFL